MTLQEIEWIARIVLAGICGLLIGFERQKRSKVAGVRTHCVVACASALMMVLSKYAYTDVMGLYGNAMGIDPSRIASGVVSGIGFLGAGMIITHKQVATGLTTAAGIWATSGIGMAIGAGMYTVGVATAVIVLLIQVVLHLNLRRLGKRNLPKQARQAGWMAKIKEQGMDILDAKMSEEKHQGGAVYIITVAVPPEQGDVQNTTRK